MALRRLRSFLRGLLNRASFERDMSEEMRFHLQSRADDLVRRGAASDDARRQARLEFGNPAARRDECREARRLHLLDDFVADVRFALRGVRRHRLLSAIVILTLTFGIGISSGVFTLFARMTMHPPVTTDPDTFVHVYTTSAAERARPRPFAAASVEEYVAFRDGTRTLRALAAFGGFGVQLGADDTRASHLHLVTCSFFDVYGPDCPRLGRLLQPADCEAAAPVIVLSHTGWLSRFGGSESVVGRGVVVALYFPARRAARVDPMVVLRAE